jgi:hypothetical protein
MTKIRLEILNLTLDDWKIVESMSADNVHLEVTPEELRKRISFSGGQFLSGKCTEDEQRFVDEYYKLE